MSKQEITHRQLEQIVDDITIMATELREMIRVADKFHAGNTIIDVLTVVNDVFKDSGYAFCVYAAKPDTQPT